MVSLTTEWVDSLHRNDWSVWNGTGGQFAPESVARLDRNTHWESESDLDPCPLSETYQLVRNILAVMVEDLDKGVEPKGHCILLYDERNPQFKEGGKADQAFNVTRENLLNQSHLRKCSWQTLVDHLRAKGLDPWLSDGLRSKYGF